MLTTEDNEVLCRVGPGTPMGNLLRRYWMPALLSSEVPAPDSPPVRVRLLGEDLVAFRDSGGKPGLFVQACPHRGASLFFGRNEESGLRCVYHGWKFDVTGACIDMPSEPAESNFRNKVRVTAYPTHESGGLIWAYMGPAEKQPGFRDFGTESMPPEQWRASKVLSTCNWVQGLEGNIDSAHIAFLHGGRPPGVPSSNASLPEFDEPGYPPPGMRGPRSPTPDLEVSDTWYGYRYVGLRKTPKGYTNARVSDFIMPFLTYVPNPYGPLGGDNLLMMVPIDDSSFWRISIGTKPRNDAARNTRENVAPPGVIPNQGIQQRTQWDWNDYLIDREKQKTESYTGIDGIAQQDLAVTESMGAIYNRSREHLGTTDKAVIRMRRMLIQAARDLDDGIDPPALDASMPYDKIRSAERVMDFGDDWRLLGTESDPEVRKLEEARATQ